MKRWSQRITIFLGVLASALVLTGSAGAQGVTNGGFETGDFTGWTVANWPGSNGSWFVYSDGVTPLSGLPAIPPPQGIYGAVTDQTFVGSHVLYQNITAGPGLVLKFDVYYVNWAGVFFTPETLDPFGVENQQYRIDLMSPFAPIFSVAPGDVLKNVFRTEVGDPTVLFPTTVSVPLFGFRCGQRLRLRFAGVENIFFFNAYVDNVRIQEVKPVPGMPCILGGD
jgi:hypothetical protein